MTPKQQAAALVSKADEDIHVLTALASDPLTTDSVWGFHAQQAVEKLLKAELAFRRIPFSFTHRLLELADLLEDAGHEVDSRFESLLDLTPYAVELRYSTLASAPSEAPLNRTTVARLVAELREVVAGTIGPE